MSDIDTLPGATPHEVQRLRAAGIATTDDLWRRATAPVDAPGADPVTLLAQAVTLDRGRLAELLARQAVREADTCTESRWTPLGALALHLGWAAMLALVVGVGYLLVLRPAQALAGAGAPADDVLVAVVDLPAYHRIEAGEVKVVQRRRGGNDLTKPSDGIGHVTLQPVPAGATIERQAVTSGRADPAWSIGRVVLSIRLEAATPADSATPARVALLVTPPDRATEPILVDDVVLLSSVREGERVTGTVAVPADQVSVMGRALSTASVFVLRKTR